MIKTIAAAAIFAALSGCAPMQYSQALQNLNHTSVNDVGVYASEIKDFLYSGRDEAEAIELGKKAAADMLKDPGSAQFRNVRLQPHLQGAVVCGEINAKNSYGGYVGFTRFAAGIRGATLEDTSTRYPTVSAAANAGLNLACR